MQKQRDRAQAEAKKAFLRGYEDAKRDVHAIQRMITELRNSEMSISGVSYTDADMPKSPNHGEGDLSNYAAELDELEKDRVILQYFKEKDGVALRDYLRNVHWSPEYARIDAGV